MASIRAAGISVLVLAAASQLAVAEPRYAEAWRIAAYGNGIGRTGLESADLDSDGDTDLVMGGGSAFGGNAFWSIVSFNGATGEYDITWQSAMYDPEGITALRIVEAGDTKQVWVGLNDGRIDVFNGLTRTVVTTLATGSESIRDFALADADNDGALDVVVVTDSQLLLYDPVTLAGTRTYAFGGARVAVGNVDGDAAAEVVLNTGYVLELSGADAAVQLSTAEFGAHIELGDIDDDGMAELVYAKAWEIIEAWDLDSPASKWTILASHDIDALHLIDVAGDPTPELVYGDGQWGAIHAIDTASRAELWSVANPEHGVTDIAVIDSDNDGERELLWGAGLSSSGPDHLYVHDLETRAFEWQSTDWTALYHAVDIGDVDADGEPEIVIASFRSESGSRDGLLMVFDAATQVLEWRSENNTFGGSAITGIHDLKLANVDSDSQLEIIVGSDRLYDGALYVFDGITHAKQNEALYDSGSPLNVLDTADLTGDGRPEVIAGNYVEHTGSPGVFIYVLDPLTDAVVWKSAKIVPTVFGAITDIEAADVGAAGMDLLAASSTIHSVRWSDKRHLTSATTGYRSVDAVDVGGSLEREVLAGLATGAIDVLDGETLSLIATHAVCAEAVTAIEPLPEGRALATCGSDLVVYDFTTGTVVDQAESGATEIGSNGSLVTGNVGGRAVVLAGGTRAVKFLDLSGNQLPLLNPLTATMHWRDSQDLDLTAVDADGDALAFEIVSLPRLGSAVWLDRALGELRYTSNLVDKGRDTFLVRVSDGVQYSSPAAVEIILENFAPEADTPVIELHWRGAQAADLVASDPDGDPLSFEVTADPAHGAARIHAATGVMTYTPSEAYVGQDSLSYAATDGADTVTDTVQIVLTNTSPTATTREFGVSPGTMVASRFPAEDANGDPLTYSVLSEPEQGRLTFEPDTGLFEYAPAANGSGTDSATFAASDGVDEVQGSITFRYPASGGGSAGEGGGGGGSFGWLLPMLLSLIWATRSRAVRHEAVAT